MDSSKFEIALFAGGCFWCMQHPFDKLNGVVSTSVGYTGGNTENPTYEDVCSGETGHTEAIEIQFDPAQITYSELLDVFWKNIDPTTPNRQFADIGSQYRTVIFYHNEEQKQVAELSKDEMGKSGVHDRPIVTEIIPASVFCTAEEYHQKYYKKSADRYERYSSGSGRERYLKRTWGE
ncbi:MAG: peptide-methionine (S)-S-oxide reductase MsrA [Candidatus Scalindua sp.]|jgi:methionine-S-sulfoxide reductase|nr:peptide-methionine (S)-S-oxide reductase MsrA [Candidatus Scalindua sp.]